MIIKIYNWNSRTRQDEDSDSVYKLSKQATEAFNPILSPLVPGILLVHYYFIEISHTIYMGMKN